MIAGELANDARPGCVPGQLEGAGKKFLRVRQVERRGKRPHLAYTVGCDDLRDRQDLGVVAVVIGHRPRAIAGAKVDPESETRVHEGVLNIWCPAVEPPVQSVASACCLPAEHQRTRQPAEPILIPPRPARWLASGRARWAAAAAASPYQSSSPGGQACLKTAPGRRSCRSAGTRPPCIRWGPARSTPHLQCAAGGC